LGSETGILRLVALSRAINFALKTAANALPLKKGGWYGFGLCRSWWYSSIWDTFEIEGEIEVLTIMTFSASAASFNKPFKQDK